MRALLSVYDKNGIVDLARSLHELGVELVSSGGTAAAIAEAGIPVTDVADLTGVPAILGHRVVTLHPKVHGGLLADRDDPEHVADMERYDIAGIDLVVSNLYPFSSNPSIELIDIGGPAMIRAAAKNHEFVGVLTDPAQYRRGARRAGRRRARLSDETRRRLARAAFAQTAAYDAQILAWFDRREPGLDRAGAPAADELELPPALELTLERAPGAALRREPPPGRRPLRDRRRAGLVGDRPPARRQGDVVPQRVRHRGGLAARALARRPARRPWSSSTPTRAAWRWPTTSPTAYTRAHECDPVSAFGGIVAVNRPVTVAMAEAIAPVFTEVLVAPGFEPDALVACCEEPQEPAHPRGPARRARRA